MTAKQFREAFADVPDDIEVLVHTRVGWLGYYTPVDTFNLVALSQNNLMDDDLHLIGKQAVVLGESSL